MDNVTTARTTDHVTYIPRHIRLIERRRLGQNGAQRVDTDNDDLRVVLLQRLGHARDGAAGAGSHAQHVHLVATMAAAAGSQHVPATNTPPSQCPRPHHILLARHSTARPLNAYLAARFRDLLDHFGTRAKDVRIGVVGVHVPAHKTTSGDCLVNGGVAPLHKEHIVQRLTQATKEFQYHVSVKTTICIKFAKTMLLLLWSIFLEQYLSFCKISCRFWGFLCCTLRPNLDT